MHVFDAEGLEVVVVQASGLEDFGSIMRRRQRSLILFQISVLECGVTEVEVPGAHGRGHLTYRTFIRVRYTNSLFRLLVTLPLWPEHLSHHFAEDYRHDGLGLGGVEGGGGEEALLAFHQQRSSDLIKRNHIKNLRSVFNLLKIRVLLSDFGFGLLKLGHVWLTLEHLAR